MEKIYLTNIWPVDSYFGCKHYFSFWIVCKYNNKYEWNLCGFALILDLVLLKCLAVLDRLVSVLQMDLSQVLLSKPIIVIQTSENVTMLIGALLRYRNATQPNIKLMSSQSPDEWCLTKVLNFLTFCMGTTIFPWELTLFFFSILNKHCYLQYFRCIRYIYCINF